MSRSLLRDDVYLRLRDAIVDGRLEPGQQLRDLDLAEQLGVSRTPVREALLKLADSGLVVALPGRSTVVAQLVADDVRDARDVVAAMHEVAVRTAVGRITAADLAAMRSANQRFEQALERSDIEAALRADDDFHQVPVVVSANRAAQSVLDQFTPVVRRAERLRFSGVTGRDSVALHERLLQHMEQGDVDAAAQVAFDTWHSLAADPGATEAGHPDAAPAVAGPPDPGATDSRPAFNYLDRRAE
ncbi:MAG: GntR family transcriptional regulator [Nocardioides sp.]